MQRFYFPAVPPERPTFDDPTFVHQVSRVLRMREGDRAILFSDGGGGEYEIVSVSKRDVSFQRIREITPSADPRLEIILFQAIPNRQEKIEYLLQKGTEVGISEFVFFPSERSQKFALTQNKLARFEKVVSEALEQCGGFRKPSVSFAEAPSNPFDFPVALFHTSKEGSVGILEFAQKKIGIGQRRIWVLVGPEGGFSEAEITAFTELWAAAVLAGERILRTETAGSVAAFFLLRTAEG